MGAPYIYDISRLRVKVRRVTVILFLLRHHRLIYITAWQEY